MKIIFFLVPISLVILMIAMVGFIWAIRSGQYDDLDRHGRDILLDDANHHFNKRIEKSNEQ